MQKNTCHTVQRILLNAFCQRADSAFRNGDLTISEGDSIILSNDSLASWGYSIAKESKASLQPSAVILQHVYVVLAAKKVSKKLSSLPSFTAWSYF